MTSEHRPAAPHPSHAIPPSVNSWNAEYLDAIYAQFKADPMSVPADVRSFLQGFDLGLDRPAATPAAGSAGAGGFEACVKSLTEAYRTWGHLAARVDPLDHPRGAVAALELSAHGLSQADLSRSVPEQGVLSDLVARLRRVYCSTIGAEFSYCATPEERAWFVARFEGDEAPMSAPARREVLRQVTISETLERWLGKRYPGKKRFSLEGGESLIPMLRFLTDHAGSLGIKELILGMAHRGRLNVLRHYLGKDTERLITEFEDSWAEGLEQGGGDVKYHRGYSGDQETPGGTVHLSMLNNPSHLESVNALVMGRTRSRQDSANKAGRNGVGETAALLIHGDAALPGQGVVTECLNMAYLPGYNVGGTIHLVINNQVGFTTDPSDDRSTEYCTDAAKMINAPVLHVNGDDPEACVRACVLAIDYRQKFGKDVFVDLVCFRRHGHNEQDEPGYTQPALYARVRAHPGSRAVYAKRLGEDGVVSASEAQAMVDAEIAVLDRAQDSVKSRPVNPVTPPGLGRWVGFVGKYTFDAVKTGVDQKTLGAACAALGRVPEGFSLHPKLKGLLESRAKLPETNRLSHADGEVLAFTTLVMEGTDVRLAGQDARRGTFSQRHAVLRDEKTGERYTPMNHVLPKQGAAQIWDSPLSEYSVLGFEYGYSRANPHCLVVWEAQFGDFCNTAQVIIDQYMASSEIKWDRWAGVVLLLPHGYEGQGPEHSSARLERFLQLCADDNMEVVYPSTGAQTFHLLRRHVKRNFRKPLVVMTPKKFLRVETARTDELVQGEFRHIIDDPHVQEPKKVAKVVYCSGKFYHELLERREALKKTDLAIVRVEQLYPLHAEMVRTIDGRYPKGAPRVWAQEESRNAGAFLYAMDAFRERAGIELSYSGRPASATPATGSEHAHKKQQEKILSAVVGPLGGAGEPVKGHPQGENGSPATQAPEPAKQGKSHAKVGR